MRLVLCWLALSLGSSPCVLSGQTYTAPPNPKARHTVAGSVVNSITGVPIPRALVRINGPEQHTAFTGSDGRFQIDNVPEGRAYVAVQKPGFFDPSLAPGTFTAPKSVTLGAGTGDLLLKLIPQAEIHGRVVDRDGEPVENVPIELLAQDIVNGRKQWQPRGGGSTNENGVYRIENLQPGRYAVRSGSHPVFPGYSNVGADGRLVPEVYPPQFYPNTPDLSTAQAMDLKPGEESEADFTLSPVRSFTISGTVLGVQGSFFVECLDSDGFPLARGFRRGKTPGSFSIMQIPAGSWTLRFRSNAEGQAHPLFAEQAITLSSSDIHNFQVQVQSLSSIPVHIVNGLDRPNNMQLQLVAGKQWQGGAFQAFPQPGDPPGSLAFHDIPPGVYTLSAQPVGAGCIESIMSGSTDLTRNDLTVSADSAPAPIEITLLDKCGTISGSVTGGGQMSGFALLVPESPSLHATVMPVQGNGKFTFANVSPGGYRLYAFADINGLEYANPEAMRDFTSRQVEVAADQQAQVDLEMISRGDK